MKAIATLEAHLPPWLRRILPTGKFTWNVAVLAGGTAIGQGLTVLAAPFLTRLYTPSDFGMLAVYISLLSILGAVATLSYDFAIPLPKDDKTGASILVLALMIVFSMSCLTGLGVWLGGDWIVARVNTPALKPYLWLLPISLLGLGTYTTFNEWAVRKGTFARIAQTRLSQSIGKVISQLGMGWLGVGTAGLLVGDLIGRVSGTGTLASLAWRHDREALRQVNLAGVREVAYRYRRFPLFSSGATLLNNLGLRLPTLLFASIYGSQVMGWLELGEQILAIPLGLISTSVAQVYVSESAKALHTSPDQLPKLLRRVIGGMLLVAFPYVLFLVLFAPKLFPIIFGEQWTEAGVYVQILAVTFLLQSIANPTGGTLSVLERQDLHFLREIFRVVIITGTIVFIGIMRFDAITGIALLSLARSLVYLLYIGISFYAIWRARAGHGAAGKVD